MASTPVRLAILANSLPPYRVQVHRRIAREMPEVRLYTVLSHEQDSRWAFDAPAEINVISFGAGESSSAQSSPRRSWHEWKKGGRIIRWLRSERIAAVLVSGYNDAGRLRVLRWCHRHAVPVFLGADSNIRDDRATGLRARVKRPLLRHILSWCHGVMPFGTRGKALFEAYGVEPSRIFFFPMEPDYDLVAGLTAESIAAASQQFGLDSRRSHLVYSGRLVQAKRVDLLIDAFAAIAPIRPRWDLLVLGDGPLQEALRARVPAELAGRVHWLGHVGDPELVGAVYRASDVLVLPSEFEPWALVVNEAVAAGLAVVSSDVPGAVADLVRDEVNGRIFPSGDLPALRACLFEVTADDKTHVFKAASARVLDEWRERGDPIRGLRAALRHVGLLK